MVIVVPMLRSDVYLLKVTGMISLMAIGLPSLYAGIHSGEDEMTLTASSLSLRSGPLSALTSVTLPVSETVNDTDTLPAAVVPSG